MTKNQIEFFKALEQKRSNQNLERLQEIKNARDYEMAQKNAILQERSIGEQARHNVALENLESGKQQMQAIYNTSSLEARVKELAETTRSNRAREKEAKRSNVAQEQLKKAYNEASIDELSRSNRTREMETERSNKAQEYLLNQSQAETRRANLAKEANASRSLILEAAGLRTKQEQFGKEMDYNYDKLNSDINRNLQSYAVDRDRNTINNRSVSEHIRSNKASEKQRENEWLTNSVFKGLDVVNNAFRTASDLATKVMVIR